MMEIVVLLLPQPQGDLPEAGLPSANPPTFYLLRSDPAVQRLLRLLAPLPSGKHENNCPALLTAGSLLPTVTPLPLSPAAPIILPPSEFGWPLTAEIREELRACGVPESLLALEGVPSDVHPSSSHLVIADGSSDSSVNAVYHQFQEQLYSILHYLHDHLPPEPSDYLPSSEERVPPRGGLPVRFASIDAEKWLLEELGRLGLTRRFGAFKFLRFLGKSDAASTFVAEYINMEGPPVVLKILRPLWMNRWTITPEKQLTSQVFYHQRLLPYEYLGCLDEIVFVVVSHREENLEDCINNLSGSNSLATLLQALKNISEALEFLHEELGAAHGAVNKDNIVFHPPHFQLTDLPRNHIRAGVQRNPLLIERRRKRPSTATDDIKDLGHTVKDLSRVKETRLPQWAIELLDRCTAPEPKDRPTAMEILHDHIIPYALPERGGLAILGSTWSSRAATIHYDLDIEGHRIAQLLESSVGKRQLTDLCDLWHEINQLTWSEVQEAHRGRLESLLAEAGPAASQDLLGRAYSPLRDHLPLPLWLIYHPKLAAVPWELMQVGAGRLCRQVPFSRSPLLDSAAAPHRQRILAAERRVRVLIADFSGDLPFARDECRRLRREFEECCLADRLDIEMLDEGDRWQNLTDEIRKSDVIHFAGHAQFDPANPANSALILGNGERLPASSLLDYWREGTPPLLFFANGCAAAQSPPVSEGGFTGDARTGLGHALIAAGVASYVGTAWPIPDDPRTVEFASAFYRHFFAGYSAAHAMLEARNTCARTYGESDLVWARYILFGHPFNRIDLGLRSTS